MRSLILIAMPILLLAPQEGAAQQSRYGDIRQALVIGNNNYLVGRLTNPVNDARAMKTALSDLGFDVTLLIDATSIEMKRHIGAFIDGIKPDAVVVLYFAGHGVEIDNHNYLIPVDLSEPDQYDVQGQSYNVTTLLEKLENSRARIRLLILDACRDNPFEKVRGLQGRGLVAPDTTTGSYVAFSTSPGSVARDGSPEDDASRTSNGPGSASPSGGHSVFTAELVKELENGQPGSTLEDVFTNVRVRVRERTKGKQTPYSNTGLLGKWYPFGRSLPEPTQSDVDSSMGILERAVRLMADGQNQTAQRTLDSAIKIDWKNSSAYLYRGILRGIGGDHAGEIEDLNEAIRLNPSNYRAYLNRGLALKGGGKCLDAIADFNRAADMAPNEPEIYRYRAVCQVEVGNNSQALSDFRKLSELLGDQH